MRVAGVAEGAGCWEQSKMQPRNIIIISTKYVNSIIVSYLLFKIISVII